MIQANPAAFRRQVDACSVCRCTYIQNTNVPVDAMYGFSFTVTGILVNCSGRGLVAVPSSIPTNSSIVLLNNNSIASIDDTHFAGLSNLVALSLDGASGGQSLSISDSAFVRLRTLRYLSLVSNLITSLSPLSFRNMTTLTALLLKNNKLATLPEAVFAQLVSLRSLTLQNNGLTTLSANSFKNAPGVRFLDVSHNKIGTLYSGTFTGLSTLLVLLLNDNNITTIEPNTFPVTARALYMQNNPSTCSAGITKAFRSAIVCNCADGYAGVDGCLAIHSIIPYVPPAVVVGGVEYEFSFPEPITVSCVLSGRSLTFCNTTFTNGSISIPGCTVPDVPGQYACTMISPSLNATGSSFSFLAVSQATVYQAVVQPLETSYTSAVNVDFYYTIPPVFITSILPITMVYLLEPPFDIPGLSIDLYTGVITGVPTVPTPEAFYHIHILDETSRSFFHVDNLTIHIVDCVADQSCSGNGLCVDTVAFDNVSSCNCNPGHRGLSCSEIVVVNSETAVLIYILATVIPVCVLVMCGFILLRIHLHRKPADWTSTLEQVQKHLADGVVVKPREVRRDTVSLLEQIGAGNFASVRKGLLRENFNAAAFLVAVKVGRVVCVCVLCGEGLAQESLIKFSILIIYIHKVAILILLLLSI